MHQWAKHTLCDDSTDFTCGCAESVRGGAVSSRETLAGDDEGGRIRPEVEEELGQNVEGKETVMGVLELIKAEPDRNEQDCEQGESPNLNGLAADSINSGDSHPVSGNSTSTDQDEIAHCISVEDLVNVLSTRPVDGTQNN